MRLRKRHLLLAATLVTGGTALAVAVSLAASPTIEAAGSEGSGYYWRPSTAEVGAGGTVNFQNATSVPHGVRWTGGPETPSCSGVPTNTSFGTNWQGTCTFTNAGTYSFVCSVHAEMTGTITVSSSGTVTTTTPPPPSGESPESPLAGPASQALKLAKRQRGGTLRGSIELSQAAAGGKLEVDLFAPRVSLAGTGHSGRARVGRLVRSPLYAGRVSFKVPLNRPARRALRSHRRLALTVKIIVTPPRGAALTLTRAVVAYP